MISLMLTVVPSRRDNVNPLPAGTVNPLRITFVHWTASATSAIREIRIVCNSGHVLLPERELIVPTQDAAAAEALVNKKETKEKKIGLRLISRDWRDWMQSRPLTKEKV